MSTLPVGKAAEISGRGMDHCQLSTKTLILQAIVTVISMLVVMIGVRLIKKLWRLTQFYRTPTLDTNHKLPQVILILEISTSTEVLILPIARIYTKVSELFLVGFSQPSVTQFRKRLFCGYLRFSLSSIGINKLIVGTTELVIPNITTVPWEKCAQLQRMLTNKFQLRTLVYDNFGLVHNLADTAKENTQPIPFSGLI